MQENYSRVRVEISFETRDCTFEILSGEFALHSDEYEAVEAEYRASCRDLGIPVREGLIPMFFAESCRDKLIQQRLGEGYRYRAQERYKDEIIKADGCFYGPAMWHREFS